MRKRGYFGIGIYKTKTPVNVGTLWRTANILGAAFIFTIGRRYENQCSDTMKTPRHIPLFHFETIDDLHKHLPKGCPLVGVEITPDAVDVKNYRHPPRACYLLGAEDGGLPNDIIDQCHNLIKLQGDTCMNVAVAGSIVIYHRQCMQETQKPA